MGNAGDLARENQALRQRLSRLSEASLRIAAPGDNGPSQTFVARQPPCALNRWSSHRSWSM